MMRIGLLLLAFSFLAVGALFMASSFDSAITSSAQNANSSTTTNRNQNDSRSIFSGQGQQDFSKNTWELPDDADKTKNPTPATVESIARGKELYLSRDKGNCIFCHGETGSGNAENLPNLRRKPADLSDKERMESMTDGEIFWKITKGITGIMPAGQRKMPAAEQRWDVVNYVRTLAKDKQ